MRLLTYYTLDEVFQAAIEAEKRVKEDKTFRSRGSANTTPWSRGKDMKSPSSGASHDVKRPLEKSPTKSDPKDSEGKTQLNSPSASSVQCHKYRGYGHMAKECPTRRTMLILDDGTVQEQESEPEDGNEKELDHDLEKPEGEEEDELPEMFLVVRRNLSTISLENEEDVQRENLFHARCRVKGKVCSLIVDGGSCANVASQTLVDQLKLPTLKHSRPYRLQWLNECGELRVTK